MRKTVLVTGSCGFIGSHIVDELLKQKYKVRAYDSLITGNKRNIDTKKVHFVHADIRNYNALDKTMKECDYVIHQAALASVPDSFNDPIEYNDINITGTLNVLELAKKHKVKRVVLASSSAVYNLSSPYALTKLINEQYADLYYKVYGLETICLRYFNVYGERQTIKGEGAVIPSFITKMLKSQQPTINGDGKQIRDFTYVGDVAKANVLALESTFNENTPYDIGTGKNVAINDLFVEIKGILKANIDPIYAPPRKGDVRWSLAKNKQAKKELKWNPKITLRKGLKRTIEWYMEEMK